MMTIRTRNWLFILGISYCIALVLVPSYIIIREWRSSGFLTIGGLLENGADTILPAIKGSILSALSLLILVVVSRNFRRTASAEVFYFFIFILTFPQEVFLTLIYTLLSDNYPVYVIITGYRIYFFLQFLGSFSLFSAGLFANDMQYAKLEISLGITLLTAFTLSAFIPIDLTMQMVHLTPFHEVSIFLTGIKTLAVMNFLFVGYRQGSMDHTICGISIAFLLLSREILHYMNGPFWYAAGMILFVGNSWLFLHKLHKFYQWQ